MILIDSDIPMYLIGAPHRHKTDAQLVVERRIAAGERMVTDAEVLQEILQRYTAINRREFIEPAFHALLGVVDEVFPIEQADVERAKEIAQKPEEFSARDSIHLAVMDRHGVQPIMSFDADYDRYPEITRVFSV